MAASDYVDAYAALLAIKAPGVEAGYDRRLLALQSVFAAFVQGGSVPPGDRWGGPPRVLLRSPYSRRMQAQPMPDFARPF
jgi:hypothetical protein